MARMYNPAAHPGEVLRDYFGDISVTDAAAKSGVTRVALSCILNGTNGISANMALRLEETPGISVEMWTGMQSDYEFWQAS